MNIEYIPLLPSQWTQMMIWSNVKGSFCKRCLPFRRSWTPSWPWTPSLPSTTDILNNEHWTHSFLNSNDALNEKRIKVQSLSAFPTLLDTSVACNRHWIIWCRLNDFLLRQSQRMNSHNDLWRKEKGWTCNDCLSWILLTSWWPSIIYNITNFTLT